MIRSNPVVSVSDKEAEKKVQHELRHIKESLKQEYATPYGALLTPSDDDTYTSVKQLVKRCLSYEPQLMVLIGIGGSSMGTRAVLDALGKQMTTLNFLCVDTIDESYLQNMLDQFRTVLTQGKKAIVCIVTKSGSTVETIINGSLFLKILKEFHPEDYHTYVVTITDEGSRLYEQAQKEKFGCLTVPQLVGGRYSVFSAVGLFPLMMLGIDVEALGNGAQHALRTSLDESLEINVTAQNALTLYAHYQAGYTMHNLFVFSPSLLFLAQWYKQLIGESLGKKESLTGELLEVGFTPVVSLGTTDLHSVAQLYLAGPRNTFTSFIFFRDEPETLSIPDNELSNLIPGMAGRTITFVKSAIIQGTIAAFTKEQRPGRSISLEHTPESLGAFMMNSMVQTILLARLLSINPFDQPAVELYKQETRDFLSKNSSLIDQAP